MHINFSQPKDGKRPIVLVVDDDPTYQKMVSLLGEKLGVTAFSASSCAEALEAIISHQFDAILMDYRMHEVDGCQCTQQIRAMDTFGGGIPIIAVTAHVEAKVEEECMKSGMDDFLAKPFTLEQLQEKLFKWLQKQ